MPTTRPFPCHSSSSSSSQASSTVIPWSKGHHQLLLLDTALNNRGNRPRSFPSQERVTCEFTQRSLIQPSQSLYFGSCHGAVMFCLKHDVKASSKGLSLHLVVDLITSTRGRSGRALPLSSFHHHHHYKTRPKKQSCVTNIFQFYHSLL